MRRESVITTGVFVCVCIFILMVLCVGGMYGGTVFIADRGGHDVMAFDIDDTPTFAYFGSINFSNDNIYGFGPIDLTIDEVHQIMFVSFETVDNWGEKLATCRIGLIDINTFEHIGDVVFSEADDFGGICYDAPRRRLYAVERDTNLLYVLRWHPETLSLEYEDVIELAQIRYACAIVVDGDMAYITEFKYRVTSKYFEHIKQYDISKNWQYVQTIPNQHKTTCLAYDTGQGIFYSGAYDYDGDFHHMIKHVMDPNEVIVKDIGGCMTDGDVDDYTGDVYITSYEGSGSSQYGVIELWDTSGWTSDPNQAIEPTAVYDVGLTPSDPNTVLYGPAGICFWEYDPRPVVIDVDKDDGLDVCVSPEDEITYTITVYPSGADHEWVRVVDYLPDGVTYEAGFWGYDPNVGFIPPDPNYTEEGNK